MSPPSPDELNARLLEVTAFFDALKSELNDAVWQAIKSILSQKLGPEKRAELEKIREQLKGLNLEALDEGSASRLRFLLDRLLSANVFLGTDIPVIHPRFM